MTVTAMKSAGYSLEEITWVLKHKNLESLRRYLAKPSQQDKENFSSDLFKYTRKDEIDDSNSDDDFETPPQPIECKKKKNTPTSIISKPTNDNQQTNNNASENSDNQLVPLANAIEQAKDNMATPNSTSNVMQVYKQNPISMFIG